MSDADLQQAIRERERKESAEEVAEKLSRFVNNYNMPKEHFINAVLRDHNTLQQSTIRLFLETIEAVAKQEFFDGRNEAAVKTCRELVEMYEEKHGFKPSNLPLI